MNTDPSFSGTQSPSLTPWTEGLELSQPEDNVNLLSVEAVQRYLNRSRASVYRYANTDSTLLNPPYDRKKLNPEVRRDKDDPLAFRPQEVQRFAEEVLGLNPTIQVQAPEETVTHDLMRQILQELRAIHQLLKDQNKT